MGNYSFTKLFSTITDSSIWSADSDTRIVWVTLLAMSDRQGRVFAAIPGLANRARVSMEATEAAITLFLSPDKYSRTPANEGRRIEIIEGGWRLLNYEKYREMRDDEAERERKRRWAANRRRLSTVAQSSAKYPQAEAEAEAEADTKKKREPFRVPLLPEIKLLMSKAGLPEIEAEKFMAHYESNGWKVGKNPMRNYKAAVTNWKLRYETDRPIQKEAQDQGVQSSGGGGMRLVVANEEFKRVEAKMKAIRDSYSEHQSWSAEDREKFSSLRDRKAQLKQILGMQV